MMTARLRLHWPVVSSILLLLAALLAQAAHASDGERGIGLRELSLIDQTRPIKASMGFSGSDTRRIDVSVWYPTDSAADQPVEHAPLADGGPWPLIVYSHGTFGFAGNAMHLVKALVGAGYVVAAPDYPLTSRNAHTKITFADISDVSEQVKDISFIIDSLLENRDLGSAIDAEKIGTTGHSLGAVTSYFASFGLQTRDPRIKATAPIAGGDPVQTALSQDIGLYGTGHAEVSVPVLFLTAEKDVFARTTGRPGAAYSRVEPPKYELLIKRGVHVWFGDGNEKPADNKNPDCLFFEEHVPGVQMPGCEERVPLIEPERQQAITRAALVTFFDAYLKNDEAALARLRRMGSEIAEAELVLEE